MQGSHTASNASGKPPAAACFSPPPPCPQEWSQAVGNALSEEGSKLDARLSRAGQSFGEAVAQLGSGIDGASCEGHHQALVG